VRQQVNRPAEEPHDRRDERQARQEVAAERPRLILRNLLGDQPLQLVRVDVRRMQHRPHHPTS
jgi:hypothetical protein